MLGGEDGRLRLLNIETGFLEKEYLPEEKNKSAVTVLVQSTASDVLAIGLKNGRIYLKNIKKDRSICNYKQDGSITAIAFRFVLFLFKKKAY